jgi:hypothetical protein
MGKWGNRAGLVKMNRFVTAIFNYPLFACIMESLTRWPVCLGMEFPG